ncbi:MAG: AraC family transcriptional regulator [Proteobacteria bacterium]|nr:AraC family transcriptional regulator [Pseudomonadota bacterium]
MSPARRPAGGFTVGRAALLAALAALAAVVPAFAQSQAQPAPVDQQVQSLKSDVLDLNRDLFVLEQELLYPANTQVAVFVSMDAGTFFALDSVQLKIDGKEVADYLYTPREVHALVQGGVQRLYVGNLKAGKHELVAFFTGKGPHDLDYTRGASLEFRKGIGAKYLELTISDDQSKLQPQFRIKNWE